MIIVCVDDHRVMLNGLAASVKEFYANDQVYGFYESESAIDFVREHGCDVLLCEVELYSKRGTLLAEEIQKLNPNVNIIFVTVCDEREHAREVLRMRPSGYLTKPAEKKQILYELAHLRYPVFSQ